MILEYYPSTRQYVLAVPKGSKYTPVELMRDYGLDYSRALSRPEVDVLSTQEPYAAAAFADFATPAARASFGTLLEDIESSWAMDAPGHFDVPQGQELAGYQRGAIAYGRKRRNVLLADEPGLGKTVEAITLCNEWQTTRNLVICPASVRLQWVRMIQKWTTQPYAMIRAITTSATGIYEKADWTVISYELARNQSLAAALARISFGAVILDEAHFVKSLDARRTRAIFGGGRDLHHEPLASRAEHVVALSGTPLPNRPRECYTLARGLCWDAIDFMSYDAFCDRFNPSSMGMTEDGRVYVDERSGRHAELQNRLRARFMTRHSFEECMPHLKLPLYDIVHAAEDRAVKLALNHERLLDFDPDVFENDFRIMGEISTVRKEMGIAIAPQVADYAQMRLMGGERKLVIFAWHTEVLNLLEHELQEFGVVRVDGTTSAAAKDQRVAQFCTDPKTQVIIGNLLSLGTGVDGLQNVCHHAIIAEPSWTPGENVQAIQRLHRSGQANQVIADIFCAPDSIAEKIMAKALRKLQNVHAALDRRIEA